MSASPSVASAAAALSCGQYCPAFDLNSGQTAASALLWGVPTAFFTIGVPILTGCKPSHGFYEYDNTQPPAQITFEYAADAGDIPLVTKATSNASAVASFNISWEPQTAAYFGGPQIKVRPASVHVSGDGVKQVVSFEYDDQGRITRQLSNSTMIKRRSSPSVDLFSRASSASGLLAGALGRTTRRPRLTTPGIYEERYAYESKEHPLFASYHESHDPDFGVTASAYNWTKDKDGKVIAIVSSSYEMGICPSPCGKGSSCCRPVLRLSNGSKAPAYCFAVPRCSVIDNTTWAYTWEDDAAYGPRVKSLTEDLTLQSYEYTSDGRLTGYKQGNKTLQTTKYDSQKRILAQVFFVLYPLAAELWGYTY